MIFPIYAEIENQLTDIYARDSWVYEVFPPDNEQLESDRVRGIYFSLCADLNSFKEDYFFRFEKINNRIFLNTNKKDIHFQNFILKPFNSPLTTAWRAENHLEEIYLGDDYIKKNHKYERFFYLEELPTDFFNSGILYSLGDFIVQFQKINPELSKGQVTRRRNQLASIEHERVSSYREQEGREEIEELKKNLDLGREGLWNCEVWFKVKGETEQDLLRDTNEFLEIAKTCGIKVRAEVAKLERAFIETTWGVYPRFKVRPIKTGVITSVLAGLIPSQKDKLMDSGFELESVSGWPLFYDITSDIFENGHLSIAGATGSGKSLFAQYVVDHYLSNGARAIILDKGRSFEKLCRWHNGDLLGDKINFLEIKNPTYLKELVLSLMEGDKVSKEEEGYIYEVIKEGVEKNKFETHKQFVSYLERKRKGIKNYFSEFLEITTEVKGQNDCQFLFCELDNIPEKFHTPVMLYLFEKFIAMEPLKIFVFEEIHKIIKTNGERVAEYFRTMRKKGASCISITQSVNDANINDLNRVIWENSEHYAIFRHKVEIGKDFLNDLQREQIKEISEREGVTNKNVGIGKKQFAEFLISSSHYSKCVRLRVNPLKYEIFNTTKKDLDSFSEWENINKSAFDGDFRETIKAYTRIKHETDISFDDDALSH